MHFTQTVIMLRLADCCIAYWQLLRGIERVKREATHRRVAENLFRKVKGTWVKNRADTASVNAVFSWVVNQTAVDPVEVNPGGLNCSNGVLKINPDGSHLLVPHDPKQIYTYVGCKYDPNIDLRDCDRLLECLEPSQREIFCELLPLHST
jgi:putative DNA primase/helicase